MALRDEYGLAPKGGLLSSGRAPISRVEGVGLLGPLYDGVMQGAKSIAQEFYVPTMAMKYQEAINGAPMSNTERLMRIMPAADIIGGGLLAGAKVPINALASNAIRRDLPSVNETIANPMITQHNVTAEGLKIADEMGGLPMPSLAITNANAPLTKFGEISLIADKDMIRPSRETSVFPADAYTGRQPLASFNKFKDHKASMKALANDPSLKHLKDKEWFHESFKELKDIDDPLKRIQAAVDLKLIDPKKYEKFHDLKMGAGKALGDRRWDSDFLNQYKGLAKYGELKMELSPKELFTPSGNRRKSSDYTLPSVMKRMNEQKAYKQGAERAALSGGKVRSLLINKFKNLDEVKKNRSLLKSQENVQELNDNFSSDIRHAIEDLADNFGGNFRMAEDFLEDVIAGNNYSYAKDATKSLPDAVTKAKKIMNEFKKTVGKMPTEYFEAKPRRAVDLSEFKGAIAPKEITDETRQILEKHGITQIWEYGTEEQRKKLYKQFPDLLFSITSPPVTPMLMPPQARESDANPARLLRGLLPNEA